MIEYESKKKFSINYKESYEMKAKSRILNIAICHGHSHLIISTESDLFTIYPFQDFFGTIKKLPK